MARRSAGWEGSPRRSSDSGSLFTRLPEPEASSLAWATPRSGPGRRVTSCSGEKSSIAAMADAQTRVRGDVCGSLTAMRTALRMDVAWRGARLCSIATVGAEIWGAAPAVSGKGALAASHVWNM